MLKFGYSVHHLLNITYMNITYTTPLSILGILGKILGILGTFFGCIGTPLHPLADSEAWSLRDLLYGFTIL